MAKVGMLALLLLNFITSAVLIEISQIKVYPKHGSISGVFHASLSGSYAFDALIARDVCEQLGVTIADKAQVVHALKHGFETCRFGWIDEQIAVIPRIQVNPACGKGGVGIIPWRASLTTKFDVFCFNKTDFEAHAQITMAQVQKTTQEASTPHTSHSAPTASWADRHATFSGSSKSLNLSLSYKEEDPQPLDSSRAVPIALLISVLFTFLLAATVAVWYFKTSRSCMGLWDGEQQKECIETEVWDKCADKGIKEAETEVENQSLENSNDVRVTMNGDNDNESENEAASLPANTD